MTVSLPRELLRSVAKPARYVGGEYNSVIKDVSPSLIRFAFAFPDIYEIGMSNNALQIIYDLLNRRDDTWCERVFAPWTDMEEEMRRRQIPLFSLESRTPLKDFDIVGFTLQYELSATAVLNMLDLAGIPLFSAEREDKDPLIICGGPVAFNLEPLADYFDLAIIGESEEVLPQLIELFLKARSSSWDKKAFLKAAAAISGIYVPSLYTVSYLPDGTVKEITPQSSDVPAFIQKRIVLDLDTVVRPEHWIVPNMEVVHDRMAMEVLRGCPRGCRFCQAGMIYRPLRQADPAVLADYGQRLEENTGYDELGLLSLSTSDYSQLGALTADLTKRFAGHNTSLSLPSLRLDSFTWSIMEQAAQTRKSGLTFAPEAGSQRLRDVINKNITEDDLFSALSLAFAGGWNGVKLYFMLGLPTETDEDIDAIVELIEKIRQLYLQLPREQRRRRLEISVSTAVFIPKAHTPFQWAGFAPAEVVLQRQQRLKEKLPRFVKFQYHGWQSSLIEAILARGDRRLSRLLHLVWQRGQKLAAWSEHFDFSVWEQAMAELNIDPEFYCYRQRPLGEVFPWSHLDCGVSPAFLEREYERALKEKTTPQCMDACSNCGADSFEGGICFER